MGPNSSRRSAHRRLLPGSAGSKHSTTAETTTPLPRPTTSCWTNSARRRRAWSSSRRAPFEKPASPWVPDNTPRNARVKALAAIAERLAKARGAVFVDIFSPLAARGAGAPRLTDDGLHFTPAGQRIVAELIAQQLGLSVHRCDGSRAAAPGDRPQEPLLVRLLADDELELCLQRSDLGHVQQTDRHASPAGQRIATVEALDPGVRCADSCPGAWQDAAAAPRGDAAARGETPTAGRRIESVETARRIRDQFVRQRGGWIGQADPVCLGRAGPGVGTLCAELSAVDSWDRRPTITS